MATPLELTASAVLFDMDGTLVDSTGVVEMLWGRFCDEYEIDTATLLAFSHGRRTPDIVARFLPDASPVEIASVSAELEAREGRRSPTASWRSRGPQACWRPWPCRGLWW